MDWVYRVAPYVGDVAGKEWATADEFPETWAEELDTGLLGPDGRPILKRPVRGRLGFDLGRSL